MSNKIVEAPLAIDLFKQAEVILNSINLDFSSEDAKQINKAIKLLKEAIAEDEFILKAEAYLLLGKAFMLKGSLSAAEDWIMKSMAIDDTNIYTRLAHLTLLIEYLAKNELQQSKEVSLEEGSKEVIDIQFKLNAFLKETQEMISKSEDVYAKEFFAQLKEIVKIKN